jgi:hypothetical protein
MSCRRSSFLWTVLSGVTFLWAASAVEAFAAPIGKGDLVVTTSDGTQVKSEDKVLMMLPADTWLVAADVQDDWVLVRVRKDGTEVTGFVQAESLRRVATVRYADPHGFSQQYPDSWKVASAEYRGEVARRGKEYTQKLPGPDRSLPTCIISNQPEREGHFQQDINCVIEPGTVREVDDAAAKQYGNRIREILDKMGLPATSLRAEVIEVGNKKAISVRSGFMLKGAKEPFLQWQAIVPGKSQVYVFTCTADASEFWQFEALFSAVIQSIEVDVGEAKR